MGPLDELRNITGITPQSNKRSFDGIYIFLSFDLANSTSFKNSNPAWPEQINWFREYCKKAMEQHFCSQEGNGDDTCCNLAWYTWKLLGDEIIFIFPNPTKTELFKLPDVCCDVLDDICKSMETPTKNNSVILSVKATLWLADICTQKHNKPVTTEETPEETSYKRNINIAVDDGLHRMVDFLGPDIDTGFRLSHYSCHNKLAIDARLAWILYSNDSNAPNHNRMEKNSKIVAYKVLKGVWNERPYPVIWYLKNWETESLFYYFEELDEKYLGYEISKEDYKFTSIDKLEKILAEARQLEYSKYLYTQISHYEGEKIEALDEINGQSKISELHLIAICTNKDNNVLILKRSSDRKFMPDVWDFGCTYLNTENTIEESLKNGYLTKIGCEISLLEKLPVDILSISNKENKRTQALVFLAIIENDAIKLNPSKYSDYKWIKSNEYTPGDFEVFNPKGNSQNKTIVVPDFFARIECVFGRGKKA